MVEYYGLDDNAFDECLQSKHDNQVSTKKW